MALGLALSFAFHRTVVASVVRDHTLDMKLCAWVLVVLLSVAASGADGQGQGAQDSSR